MVNGLDLLIEWLEDYPGVYICKQEGGHICESPEWGQPRFTYHRPYVGFFHNKNTYVHLWVVLGYRIIARGRSPHRGISYQFDLRDPDSLSQLEETLKAEGIL